MQRVLIALLPGIALFLYLTGWGGIFNLCIAVVSGLIFEALCLKWRNQPLAASLRDYSATVTVVLFALCLPPLIPWWIVVIGTGSAILLAKHAYGGLGCNVFNPAMVGYAVVLVSYPLDLSSWLIQPDAFRITFNHALEYVLSGGLSQSSQYDSLTGATALSLSLIHI